MMQACAPWDHALEHSKAFDKQDLPNFTSGDCAKWKHENFKKCRISDQCWKNRNVRHKCAFRLRSHISFHFSLFFTRPPKKWKRLPSHQEGLRNSNGRHAKSFWREASKDPPPPPKPPPAPQGAPPLERKGYHSNPFKFCIHLHIHHNQRLTRCRVLGQKLRRIRSCMHGQPGTHNLPTHSQIASSS